MDVCFKLKDNAVQRLSAMTQSVQVMQKNCGTDNCAMAHMHVHGDTKTAIIETPFQGDTVKKMAENHAYTK